MPTIRFLFVFVFALVTSLFVPRTALACPSDLDPTFGIGGVIDAQGPSGCRQTIGSAFAIG